MSTPVVINGKNIVFTLPTTYDDGTTPLPPGAITGIKISVGSVSGGPYTKSVEDTALTPDPTTGKCSYPLASLGVDLTKLNYAILQTDIATGESMASTEVGFKNMLPAPPQNPFVA